MHSKNLITLLGLTVLAAIGVMTVSASAAQAKWLLLLNKVSVKKATGNITALLGLLEYENGVKLHCTGGTGIVSVELTNEDKSSTGSALAILTGCTWEGSEKTCTIEEGLGPGKIHVHAPVELTMEGAETYILAKSTVGLPFALIETEGAFCTIPESEEVSGAARCHLLEPLVDAKLQLCHLETDPKDPLRFGQSVVKKISGEVHISDLDPNATIGIHLVNL